MGWKIKSDQQVSFAKNLENKLLYTSQRGLSVADREISST